MGCSTSHNSVAIVSAKHVSVHRIQTRTTGIVNPQSIRYLENQFVVWLRVDTSEMFETKIEYLRKSVYNLQIYTDIQSCLTFLRNIQDEKIFLILSGTDLTLGQHHSLPQIEKIYLLNSSLNVLNDKKYLIPKYMIVKDINNLSHQIYEDIDRCELDTILITVSFLSLSHETSFSLNITKYQASFIFAQTIKEIIYRLKFDSGSKDVWIDFCRSYYVNNDNELLLIDDFARNYRPNQALRWLTTSCFISRIINRVLRTREIDVIYKLGFFFKHVHLQLNRLYKENASLMKQISVVYRGKTMSTDEFDILIRQNSGGFLSFTNFLITTLDRTVSMEFVNHRLELHHDLIGIIFEIHINEVICNEKNPFALLKDTDMNREEICFHFSTIFRIESIETMNHNETGLYVVKLRPVDDDDQQLTELLAEARSDEMHANPLSYLSKLLVDMGEHQRAEQFFLGLSQDVSVRNQPRRLVRAYIGLGALYTLKKEYVKALDHYQQALETSLTYLPPTHLDLVPIYKNLADNHVKQKNYNVAIEHYEKAIQLLRNDTQKNGLELINVLYNRINEIKQTIANHSQV
ncbi:hypothetical protein I4U23_001194 [Adineta vaga]|nr:hypothetical protein I4U23_001194 [Adineta vaga]